MESKDYQYIAFDAQYFLHRNFAALKGRTGYEITSTLEDSEGDSNVSYIITKYNFTTQDLVKQFFWTIAKIVRDSFSCNKIILLWDKPPYHKTTLLPDFKGTRTHHCQELLDDWDIESDPQGYLQEKEDYRIELIKLKAKYWIINNLNKLGMVSVIYDGYEADDLAYLFSHSDSILKSNLKSAICSADNDWLYWISNNVDWINSNKLEAWTYQDAVDECEGMTEKLGIDIFTLKQWMDSTFYSHNDLQRTTNLGWNQFEQLYSEVTNGDYTHITDLDRFRLNMKSFEILNYPEANSVKTLIETALHQGYRGDMDVFKSLQKDGFSVSESYITNYLNTITDSYYKMCPETVQQG